MALALSIVIPTYNRPEKVLLRVRELLPQLQRDTELVILDNGSDADIEHFITNGPSRTFSKFDSMQFVLKQENSYPDRLFAIDNLATTSHDDG